MAYSGPMPAHPLKWFDSITPDDNVTYDPPLVRVRIGSIAGGAALAVKNINGTTVVISECTAGELIDGPFTAIMDTSTTVTAIIGWKNE